MWGLVFIGAILLIVLYIYFGRKKTDINVLPKQFVVVDIETTGLDSSKHEIIEIGAIKVNRDSTNHETFQALIKPTIKIPKKITQITGITQDMIDSDGEDIESVLNEFIEFIGDLRLVAFNAQFDMGFLKVAAKNYDLSINNKYSCALKMARRAWHGLDSYKLVDLASLGGASTKGNHRALKDCELALTVYASAASKLNSIK